MTPSVHIVGSGLTGATIARLLADLNFDVQVFERRLHLGGNVHDHLHASGIRVHTYGPHYFRTNSPRIWSFVQRFGGFYPFEAIVKTDVDGQLQNWPIAGAYLRALGIDQTQFESLPPPRNPARHFEEAALRLMPQSVYETFVQSYTLKQWGVHPTTLSPDLIKRFNVHWDNDPRLSPTYRWQGLPQDGYAQWMNKILEGIPVHLGVDYLLQRQHISSPDLLVYTGPIDAYFNFDLGRLHYRGQIRQQEYLPDQDWYQPCVQVNNPSLQRGDHIRTIEWKHLLPNTQQLRVKGTLITRETPVSPSDPDAYEYPFPDERNQTLFQQYWQRASQIPGLLVCGRLGEYRYYDMDQAIGRAMMLVNKQIIPILSKKAGRLLANLS